MKQNCYRNASIKRAFTLAEVFLPHFASSRKLAFTLAEVLITLGIIGIVAAMTMPTIIANHQKKTTATKVKKFYSMMQQAVKLSEVENGPIASWNFGLPNNIDSSVAFVKKYVEPYLQVTQNCEKEYNVCFPDYVRGFNGVNYSMAGNKYTSLRLVDGSSIAVLSYPAGYLAPVLYDINGLAGPNQFGKDVFKFDITSKGGFATAHSNQTKEELLASGGRCAADRTTGTGEGCARLLQLDDWQFSKDYPW